MLADRSFFVNRTNAAGEQIRDAQNFYFAHSPGGFAHRHGIGGDYLFDFRVGDALDGRAGENGVRARGIHLRCAFADEGFGGFYESASGVDNVVDDQSAASANDADEVHDFADVYIDTAFIDD